MEIELTEEELDFQEEVRQLLNDELTDEIKTAAAKTTTVFADKDVALAWQKILNKRGWAGVSGPKNSVDQAGHPISVISLIGNVH